MVLALRVLFVEDSESDTKLIIYHLEMAGYIVDYERVETSDKMTAALLKHSWDLIFSDYKLKHFDAAEALRICHKLVQDIPFIVIANELSDESVVNSIKAGAHDYLIKDNLLRLIPTVARELEEAKIRNEERLIEIDLEQRKKHYRSFFKHDISGNYISTPDGQIINSNPAFAKLLGYESDADLSGIDIRELFADPSEFSTIIARLKKERSIEAIEHEMIRKDGQRIVCVENIVGITDKKGELNHCLGYIIDITEQKHSKTVLKESESRYHTLFSEMMEGFALHEIICNKEGKPVNYRFLSVNPAFERMTGLFSIDLIDKTIFEVIPNIEISWIEKYGEVALTSIPISFENYARALDRFYRVVAFCPKKGQFATIITDITESKKAEELLRQSKNRLIRGEHVFKSGNWELDLKSGIITASEGACKLYGIKGEKWNFETIKNIPLPEYRALLDNSLSLLINDAIPYDIEFKIKQIESEQVIDIHSIAEYDSQRGIIFGVIKDITERKRAEHIQKVLYDISTAVITTQNLEELIEIIRKQLGTLLDTSNFYVAFYDEVSKIFHTPHAVDQKDNMESWPAEKSMTGYLIKQKKVLLVSAEDVLKLVERGEIQIIGTPSKLWLGVPLHEEKKIIGAFVVQSYDNPNAYTLKDVEMLEFISHQISIFVQRKRADEELKAALIKAEESDQLKSAFLATMNHELRTPLNHILGFSELIIAGVMPEDNQNFASSIYSSGKNLLAIVEDVFDLALAEQANVKVRLQTFRLMDQFMENKSSFDHILQSSGKAELIQLTFKPDTRLLSMYLTVDRSKVNQILINLFKNAVKFTNTGTIEFGYQSTDYGRLTFFIKDTGIGIPKDKQSVIFDFFRQGDDSRTRVYGGIGIGLAIAQKIAKILKGELSVISEPDKGSAFYLTVPVELTDISDPF